MGNIESADNQYIINNYRCRKIEGDILVTTDHGSWAFLTEKDFDLLRKNKVEENGELFKLLEEKGIILTEKNKDAVIELLRSRYSFLFNGASLHIVIPTLRCNQKCVYCHASSKTLDTKGYDMDEKTAKAVVDFIFQSPSESITIEFQGGEPLLSYGIIKYIIEYAKKLNQKYKKDLRFALVSNLILIDDEKLDYLVSNKVGICTSLDGPEKLHNQNRGYFCQKGSYFYVKKGIEKIQERYRREIDAPEANALITITKESLKYPKEIVDGYVELGLKGIHLRFLNNLGDARPVWNEIGYSSEEFMEFWKKAVDYILEINKRGLFFAERTCLIILQKIFTEVDPGYLDLRSPCGAAIGQLAYTPNGDIFSCDEARMVGEGLFKLGGVKENNYKEVLSSNKTCSLVASSINDCQICDYCCYKPYCGICPVCNFIEQGNIIGKIHETPRCKIYKEQFTYIFKRLRNPEDKKIFLNWLEYGKRKKETENT